MKMSVSIELLDAFKAAQGGISDYRVAEIIDVHTAMMSKYRKGRSPLSPEKVLFLCEYAGFDSLDWLLKLYRERAKSSAEISALDNLIDRLAA